MQNEEQPHGRRLGWLKNGNPPCDLSKLPRCTAKAKSTGNQCKQPAMENGKCHWHGGKSPGAPKGNTNAYKNGFYASAAIAERNRVRDIISEAKKLLKQIG